jgi:hypothetical protein
MPPYILRLPIVPDIPQHLAHMSATPSLRKALFLRISVFFLLVLQIDAYVLSQACYNYNLGGIRTDISNGMHAAMEEAGQKAAHAMPQITHGEMPFDNSRGKLFRTSAEQDFIDVQSTMSKPTLENLS